MLAKMVCAESFHFADRLRGHNEQLKDFKSRMVNRALTFRLNLSCMCCKARKIIPWINELENISSWSAKLPDLTIAELTTAIVAAYVSRNAVQAVDLPALIVIIHASLSEMSAKPEAAPEPAKLIAPISIRKSVTDGYLISLEDGKRYQALKRHLTKLGMTPAEYRIKWGLPADYPMVAPAYSARRSALAKSIGLGNIRKKS